jgi:hypothetical protein|tara:strand:- start:314 stop:664 length:351 start_codon:yes stop_codon:yes gene_type:complete
MAPTFTSPTPVHSHRFICLDLDGGAYKISVLGQGIIVCEGVHIHQVLSRCLQHFGGEKNLGAAKLAILLGGSGLPCHGTRNFWILFVEDEKGNERFGNWTFDISHGVLDCYPHHMK